MSLRRILSNPWSAEQNVLHVLSQFAQFYKFLKAQYQKSFHLLIVFKKCLFVSSSFQWRMDELYLQIWLIIEFTHVGKQRLRNAVKRSPDDGVQIPCMDPQGFCHAME